MEWTPEKELEAEKLLIKLMNEPLAKERQEFGELLMRHTDSYTNEERKRYEELSLILQNDELTNDLIMETVIDVCECGVDRKELGFCPRCDTDAQY